MSPSAGYRHQRLSSQLWPAFSAAAPADCEVLEAINVRVAPGRILIPDLARGEHAGGWSVRSRSRPRWYW